MKIPQVAAEILFSNERNGLERLYGIDSRDFLELQRSALAEIPVVAVEVRLGAVEAERVPVGRDMVGIQRPDQAGGELKVANGDIRRAGRMHIVAHQRRDLGDRAEVIHQLVKTMDAALEEHSAGVLRRIAAPVAGLDFEASRVGCGFFKCGDGSQRAAVDQVFRRARCAAGGVIRVAHTHDASCAALCFQQKLDLLRSGAERLLDENMQTFFHRPHHVVRMIFSAAANDDGLNVRSLQKLVVTAHRPRPILCHTGRKRRRIEIIGRH